MITKRFPADPPTPEWSDESSVLAEVVQAFSTVPRPEHFTDYTHCEECAAHDALLCSRNRDTLEIGDLNPGSDPICFINDQGFAYYFPALARLCLTEAGSYLPEFLFHMQSAQAQLRERAMSPWQRACVRGFLLHVFNHRLDLIDDLHADDLFHVLSAWEAADIPFDADAFREKKT